MIHEVIEGEVAAPEMISSVSEVGWEWRPGEGETALAVHTGPVGAVIELSDGLVGLRGDTGDELWRYRVPGTEGFAVSFSPTDDFVLAAAAEAPAVLLDATTGEVVAEDVDWDDRARLLGGNLLLDRQGDATEVLFRVRDLETGQDRWQQVDPVLCSEGGASRLVSTLHHGEAIVLLLHCDDNTSEEALRAPDPGTVNALVALDPADGRELWRRESVDAEGRGLASAFMLEDTLVADLPGEDGWLILDPAYGEIIAESTKPILSVQEDKYLAGPDPRVGDRTHELRTFSGEVLSTATIPNDRWPGDLPGTAVGLSEQLVTVDIERGSPQDSVNAVITDWNGGGQVISATMTETASNFEPGRLLSVPGALIMYVPVNPAADIEAIEHVAALR